MFIRCFVLFKGFGLDRDMQFSSKGDLYIKNSDESLQKFADYSLIMYLASKQQ